VLIYRDDIVEMVVVDVAIAIGSIANDIDKSIVPENVLSGIDVTGVNRLSDGFVDSTERNDESRLIVK
jgi:hypothetical protein